MMKPIYQSLADLESTRQPGGLCAVVKTSSLTPRCSSRKMLIYSDGHVSGSVDGGELENRIRTGKGKKQDRSSEKLLRVLFT